MSEKHSIWDFPEDSSQIRTYAKEHGVPNFVVQEELRRRLEKAKQDAADAAANPTEPVEPVDPVPSS